MPATAALPKTNSNAYGQGVEAAIRTDTKMSAAAIPIATGISSQNRRKLLIAQPTDACDLCLKALDRGNPRNISMIEAEPAKVKRTISRAARARKRSNFRGNHAEDIALKRPIAGYSRAVTIWLTKVL